MNCPWVTLGTRRDRGTELVLRRRPWPKFRVTQRDKLLLRDDNIVIVKTSVYEVKDYRSDSERGRNGTRKERR